MTDVMEEIKALEHKREFYTHVIDSSLGSGAHRRVRIDARKSLLRVEREIKRLRAGCVGLGV